MKGNHNTDLEIGPRLEKNRRGEEEPQHICEIIEKKRGLS